MGEQELAAIEARLDEAGDPPATFAGIVERDVPALIAEVRRLRSVLLEAAQWLPVPEMIERAEPKAQIERIWAVVKEGQE